jgi:restriction system protein
MSRRRKNDAPAAAFQILAILLLLAGSTVWAFWKSLPPESQVFFAFAGSVAILSGLGALGMLAIYRKRQRAAIWRRAMATWKQSSRSNAPATQTSVYLLSPYELEKFAAHVYNRMGYRVTHTGRSGDHGVDLRLVNPRGQIEIVQCKQWSKPVGEPEVRNLVGAMVHEKAVRGFLWAPLGFTLEAQRWAKGKPLVLADEREIGRIVESVFG